MPLKEYPQIKLRDKFQSTIGDRDAIDSHPDRTPRRDDVAEYVLEEVIPEGRWPMDMTQLAEETGYSRQHVSNVIQRYFVGVDENESATTTQTDTKPFSASPSQVDQQATTEPKEISDSETVFVRVDGKMREVTIDIPSDVGDRSSYVRGYLDAVDEI